MATGFTFPAGYVHLPEIVSDEWIKQLVAEQQVIVRSRRGFAARSEWRQLRPRNEALDCRTYARAAVWLAGVDRWNDIHWRDLEEQLGLNPPSAPKPAAAANNRDRGRTAGRPNPGATCAAAKAPADRLLARLRALPQAQESGWPRMNSSSRPFRAAGIKPAAVSCCPKADAGGAADRRRSGAE